MANINLLPWREEAREKQKKDYIGILALVFLVSSLVVYLALGFVDMMTDNQKSRNAYLQSEISLLEKQIAEIKEIKTRKKDIERRTEIILNLQQSRNLPTHVLDELVRIIPPGIYLSSIEKKGSLLWIEGRSESNNNVANMMRKVKTSMWLHNPNMQSIVAQNIELRQLQRFSLKVTIKESDQAEAVQGASK
ncbi:PilN domain-containing protein [Shewanella psychropiezotolerans]|uniref:PilN domain-containing protein n=1 Tax=Shewanella psychropiezotolerans TaxID=2593655 RepID=A0ABX5WWS3_9GAMM|nr:MULTISPECIES: PilN domain-containing protein [Shewanella]MPY25821.1 PilN domain-containing protein [Shewanella sp. YLB-07]QDO82153.1 PilN domain-containing protein [Shewanella psychropiezotolerans]